VDGPGYPFYLCDVIRHGYVFVNLYMDIHQSFLNILVVA
jgi:hypothetical protein